MIPCRNGVGDGHEEPPASRLAKAFGSKPKVWAGIQLDYDMAQAMKQADRIKVERVPQPVLKAE